MTPADPVLWDRWQEVDDLLAAALEQPAAERAAFVDRATVGDAVLRDLVLRLTRHAEHAADRADAPSGELVRRAFSEADEARERDDLAAGTRIGRYRIGNKANSAALVFVPNWNPYMDRAPRTRTVGGYSGGWVRATRVRGMQPRPPS